MEWIFFAMIGPMFWTVSNFIDKYAIEKVVKGIADYAFFGSIGPIVVITILLLFFDITVPSLFLILLTMSSGFLLNYAYMLYGITLSKTDVSRVIPIYQLRPILVLTIGAFALGQFLNGAQLLGFFVALSGVLLVSLNFSHVQKVRLSVWSLFALLGTFAFSIIILINDFAVKSFDIPSVIFYADSGFLLASASYLLHPTWRRQIIEGLRFATWRKFLLFTINDAADELAQLFSKIALAGAPAAALVVIAQGIHSFYALIGGLMLTVWFPNKIKEDISKRTLTQKFIGALLIFIGVSITQLPRLPF